MADSGTIYAWEGLNKNGDRVKGETPADSEAVARSELRKNGINVVKIRKKPKSLLSGGKKKIVPADIAYFLRQMTTMLQSGVPLVQAFEIVGRGNEKPAMRDLVLKLKADVEGGETFAAALAKQPKYFDDLVVNLVEAGEQAGTLETLLDKVATYKEKTEALKAKIRKAMFYPAAVIVVAIVVTAILLIYVVPQFEALFQGFGADLPVFTRMVVDLSDFVQSWWWLILAIMVAIGFAFVQTRQRSPRFARFLDIAILKAPAFGPILRKAAIARFARTLSTMFSAGVPLVDALTRSPAPRATRCIARPRCACATRPRPGHSCSGRCAIPGSSPTWSCRWSRSARNPARWTRCWRRSRTSTRPRSTTPWTASRACWSP